MISAEDCEFIKKFEVANSEEKQVILTNEGHQVSSLLCYLCICVCSDNVLHQSNKCYSSSPLCFFFTVVFNLFFSSQPSKLSRPFQINNGSAAKTMCAFYVQMHNRAVHFYLLQHV